MFEKIWTQNPSQKKEPDFSILCLKLKECSIYYWGSGNFKWLLDMLESATMLESFHSYKLRVGYFNFASNQLRNILLHRAELFERVEIWAPCLTDLNVQAAYDLKEIDFIKYHTLGVMSCQMTLLFINI